MPKKPRPAPTVAHDLVALIELAVSSLRSARRGVSEQAQVDIDRAIERLRAALSHMGVGE